MQNMKFNSDNNFTSGQGLQSQIKSGASGLAHGTANTAKAVIGGLKKRGAAKVKGLKSVKLKAVAFAAVAGVAIFTMLFSSATPSSLALKSKNDMNSMGDKITDDLKDAYFSAQSDSFSEITSTFDEQYGCSGSSSHVYPIDWNTRREVSENTGAYMYEVTVDPEIGGTACSIAFRFENPTIDAYGDDSDTSKTSNTNLVYSYALALNETISSYSNLLQEAEDDENGKKKDDSYYDNAVPEMTDSEYEAANPSAPTYEIDTQSDGKDSVKTTEYGQKLIDDNADNLPDGTNDKIITWLDNEKSNYFYADMDTGNWPGLGTPSVTIPEYVDMSAYRSDKVDDVISAINKYGSCKADGSDTAGTCTKTQAKKNFWKMTADRYNSIIGDYVECDMDRTSKTYGWCDYTKDHVFVNNMMDKYIPSTDPNATARTRKSYSGAVNMSSVQNEPQVAKDFYDYLYKKGLSMVSICAILGNVQVESGFNPSAYNPNDNGSPSGGLCQWHLGRLTRLYDFARSQGKDWTDEQLQFDYFWSEYSNAWYRKRFESMTDVSEATIYFAEKFEVCADPDSRGKYGVEQLNNFSKAAVVPTDGSGTTVIVNKGTVNHATGDTAGNAYPWGQCTWWAYERRHQLGLPCGSYFGNGGSWAASAASLGYAVDGNPQVGDVIVFRPGQDGASSVYGHVAVVEAVHPESNSVTISESNAAGLGVVSYRTIYNAYTGHQYIHS